MNKNQMMEELSEYDNLIRAMGALFYTSKRMQETIPCVFQCWKEYIFEKKAKKIRTFLSNDKKNTAPQPKNPVNFDSTELGGKVLESKDFS